MSVPGAEPCSLNFALRIPLRQREPADRSWNPHLFWGYIHRPSFLPEPFGVSRNGTSLYIAMGETGLGGYP